MQLRSRQAGVSLIAAIFMLVGLAALGTAMMSMLETQQHATLDELSSAQALYAAESGVQWAAFKLNQSAAGSCGGLSALDQTVSQSSDQTAVSTFSVYTEAKQIGSVNVCDIRSVGTAGNVQREILVTYYTSLL